MALYMLTLKHFEVNTIMNPFRPYDFASCCCSQGMRAAAGHHLHGRRLDLGAAKIQPTHLVAEGTGHIQDASQGVGESIGRTITE